MDIARYIAKAISGGAVAAAGVLLTAMQDGNVSTVEWVLVALFGVGGLAVVYEVPNGPNPNG